MLSVDALHMLPLAHVFQDITEIHILSVQKVSVLFYACSQRLSVTVLMFYCSS